MSGPPPSNPFSTHRTRPGQLPFLFAEHESEAARQRRLADLLASLQASRRAAIVGPHGSGKSTLCENLAELAKTQGAAVRWVRLRGGESAGKPLASLSDRPPGPDALVVIDGFEQLGRWRRWRLMRQSRRSRWLLLATMHRAPFGMPVLYRTESTAPLMRGVVRRLLAKDAEQRSSAGDPRGPQVTLQDAEASLAAQGSIREALFALYDLHERRLRESR